MRTLTFLSLFVAALALSLDTASSDEKPTPTKSEPAKTGVAALAWLSGRWVGGGGDEGIEAVYTTTSGGVMLSSTKFLNKGTCVFYDFERFFLRGKDVIMTPFPAGNRSVEFTLNGFKPKIKRARFSNEKHDFPKHLTYERTGDKTLKITLEGEEAGKAKKMVLDLRRP